MFHSKTFYPRNVTYFPSYIHRGGERVFFYGQRSNSGAKWGKQFWLRTLYRKIIWLLIWRLVYFKRKYSSINLLVDVVQNIQWFLKHFLIYLCRKIVPTRNTVLPTLSIFYDQMMRILWQLALKFGCKDENDPIRNFGRWMSWQPWQKEDSNKRINKVRKRDCPLKNSNDLFAHKENATAIHPSSSGKNSPQQCQCQKDDSIFDDAMHISPEATFN